MNRYTETWFVSFWLAVLVLMLVLICSGCTLPKEGQNYNPTRQYQWVP